MIYDIKTQGIMREGMLVDVTNPQTKKNERVPLKYRKLDAQTIEFTFPVPYAPARSMLSFPIAPRHKLYNAWKQRPNQFDVGRQRGRERVGRLWAVDYRASYVPAQRVVYKRNPFYWKKDAQGRPLPYLDSRVVLMVKDLNALTIKFKAKETDALGVQPPDYALIKQGEAQGNYTVYNQGPGWGFEYLTFNQ